MSKDFLPNPSEFWGDDDTPPTPTKAAPPKAVVVEPEIVNGRAAIVRSRCPVCGGTGCTVKFTRLNKEDKIRYPFIYCKKKKKYQECFYKYI